MRIADAEPRPDRRAERHHGRRACVRELAADDRVVRAVRQHGEALGDQRLGTAHELLGVGIKQLSVADHFEFDPVGFERLARELGGQHRVFRGLTARRIWKETDVLRDEIDQAFVPRRRG